MGGIASPEVRARAKAKWNNRLATDPVFAELERLKRQQRWARWYAESKSDHAKVERRRLQKQAEYLRNQDKREAKKAEWAKSNRERTRATWKRFYWNNVEAQRLYAKTKPKDIEKRRQADRAWKKRNPLKVRAKVMHRIALLKGATVGRVDYARVVEQANGRCGICELPIDNGQLVHIDHIVPLSRGGSHTQDNLQLSHATCNLKKGNSLPVAKVG